MATTKEVSLGEHASCYKGAVDTARPETPSASSTRGLSGTAHQRHRRKNSAAALPARGGVGDAREFPGPPSRPYMGRPHPWGCRTEEADRGDRRHRLRAGPRFQEPTECLSGSARGCVRRHSFSPWGGAPSCWPQVSVPDVSRSIVPLLA